MSWIVKSQGCIASIPNDDKILYSEITIVVEGTKQFSDVWLMDPGATWHVISRKEWFHQYEPISGGFMFMGKWSCLREFWDWNHQIKNVWWCNSYHLGGTTCKRPEKNLLSLWQLDCKTHIKDGIMEIVKGVLVMMKSKKITINLYMLKGQTLQEGQVSIKSIISTEGLTMMWHCKHGHISEHGLNILS